MLARRGIQLVFQPPYHPVFNTCEHCFQYVKCMLRWFPFYTEHFTEAAIAEAFFTSIVQTMRQFDFISTRQCLHGIWLPHEMFHIIL